MCTHGLSTLAKSSCAERSSSRELADVVARGELGIGEGAPKQSELKHAPLRSSNRPMVPIVEEWRPECGQRPVSLRLASGPD